MDWVALISGIVALATLVIKNWFEKTPEQKERDRINDQDQANREAQAEVHNAVKKAGETGDTSDIEKLLKS